MFYQSEPTVRDRNESCRSYCIAAEQTNVDSEDRAPPTTAGTPPVSLTDGEAAVTHGDGTADTGRTGIVLAGGRSERFPTVDKALAPLDGEPLVHHAAATLAPVVDDLVVNCRRDQREAFAEALAEFDPAFAIDAVPDRGPLVDPVRPYHGE